MAMDKTKDEEKPRLKFKTKIYKGVMLLENEIEEIENMEIHDDDIWVCSYPRSGTTLVQEMVYLITTGDWKRAREVQLDERFPIIEVLDERFPFYGGIKMVEKLPRPRLIKSHLHQFLLPEKLRRGKGKIIYTARNVKDCILSQYRILIWLDIMDKMSFQEYFELFMKNQVPNTPWTRHVKEYWDRGTDGNVLFLKYEDTLNDMAATIRKIANFLDKTVTTDDVGKIIDHCSLENMRANDKLNMSYYRDFKKVFDDIGGFINKGRVGTWKEHFTEEMSTRIDEMLEKDLKDTGLSFQQQ